MTLYDFTTKKYRNDKYGDDKIKFTDSKLFSVHQSELPLDLNIKINPKKLLHFKHCGYFLKENEQVYNHFNQNLAFGNSLSLFPFLENSNLRYNEPNADAFEIIFAIADGCYRGVKPAKASHRAVIAFCKFLKQNIEKVKTIKDAIELIAKALDWANRSIYSESEDIWSNGCAKFLGGIVLNLLDEREIILFVQLGDCKLYKYSHQNKRSSEIQFPIDLNTVGRLGPSVGNGETCLNGLKFGWAELEFGSIVIAATDGLWRNLGRSALFFKFEETEWNEMNGVKKMTEIINKQNKIDVETITNSLMQFAFEFTEEYRDFCSKYPTKRIPETIPGFVSHITIYSFTCGTIRRILKILQVTRVLLQSEIISSMGAEIITIWISIANNVPVSNVYQIVQIALDRKNMQMYNRDVIYSKVVIN